MERSRTQVLFSYLPGVVFVHESGLVARTHSIRGQATSALNREVLLAEIDRYLEQWTNEKLLGIARPSRAEVGDFRVITPELVRWELWPLKFECSRESCGRIVSFLRAQDISRSPRCQSCRGPLRQLRYYSAHECGRLQDMYVPKCTQCGEYKDVYFEDTGTFRTATFRCRACGNAIIRRTLQSPCTCPSEEGARPMMHAYTVRDTRTYYPHRIALINLQSQTFNDFQAHPARGTIAVASYLGLLGPGGSIRQGMDEANRSAGSSTMSAEQWTIKEQQLRAMEFSKEQIADIKRAIGPREDGLSALAQMDHRILSLGGTRPIVERAALFDTTELQRITLEDTHAELTSRGEAAAALAVAEGMQLAAGLGIDNVAVTWSFPIAMATFGYTREVKEPGKGVFQGFYHASAYEGKYPIFAVSTDTEALLVTLSPRAVLAWLARLGHAPAREEEQPADARRAILGVFANRESNPEPASLIETLVHSASHALLRALDDGQVGFAEASLAEWVVPETLTFALYASSLKSYTMGALWTLLNNRTFQWLSKAVGTVLRCENDPLCHQRSPRACERCMYLTFGCPRFNDCLDRKLLASFWREGSSVLALEAGGLRP